MLQPPHFVFDLIFPLFSLLALSIVAAILYRETSLRNRISPKLPSHFAIPPSGLVEFPSPSFSSSPISFSFRCYLQRPLGEIVRQRYG